MAELNGELRRFLFDCVYRNHRVYRMSIKARRVLEMLFRSYEEFPQQLPPRVLREGSPSTGTSATTWRASRTARRSKSIAASSTRSSRADAGGA
jgi:dGTP triphosphohydrolase